MPSRLSWVYKIYGDGIINGERCIIFSVTRQENLIYEDDDAPQSGEGVPPEHIVDVTEYFYVSTVSGLCVINNLYSAAGDTTYQAIKITLSTSPSLTDVSAFELPANIIFSPYTP